MISNDLQWLFKSQQRVQNQPMQIYYKENSRTNQLHVTVLVQQKVR